MPSVPKEPKFELPPIGVDFVLEYDGNDTDFPVIAQVRDPRAGAGQKTPQPGDAHPDTAKYPNHKFVEARVTHWQLRVLWIYMILPGTTLSGYDYDEATGLLLPFSKQKVVAGTSGTTLQSNGNFKTIQPVSAEVSIATTSKATALTTRTYGISHHVSLPRVLSVFTPVSFMHKDGYLRSLQYYVELRDYSGTYDITVYEEWKSTPHTCAATKWNAKGFEWISPWGSGSVPECLHGEVTVSGTTGTDDPVWAYIAWSQTYAATTPTALSGTVVIEDTQQPWRGGYLRHKESITVA